MHGPRRPDAPKLPLRIAGRLPPHDLAAEAAVLSTLLLDSRRLELVLGVIQAADYYSDAHRLIYSTIVELSVEASPIDTVTVGGRLQDRQQLGAIGGAAYLAQIVDATPATQHVVAHAQRVATLARERRVIDAAHRIVAEGYSDHAETYAEDAARTLADVARLDTRGRSAISRAWRPIPEAMLHTPPPARSWLLRHPTRDGQECAPQQGDGMLPLGKAGVFLAEGGAGKTMALLQLALGVITGRPWLGHFPIGAEARRGRVLLALAEEDLDECHRRLWAAADLLRLSDDERALVRARLVLLPLAGSPVALVGYGPDQSIIETEELRELRRYLREDSGTCPIAAHAERPDTATCEACRVTAESRMISPVPTGTKPVPNRESRGYGDDPPRPPPHPGTGWSLVVLDPLARWAGPDVESDNSAATRFVQAVESLIDAPGRPTVLVAHHTSKDARKSGKADSRGVTAITDGFRWAGALRTQRGFVLFGQQKSNYSVPMVDELTLVRGPGGVLRVRSQDEERYAEHLTEERSEEREAARDAHEEARIAKAVSELLRTVARSKVAIPSRAALVSLATGRQAHKQAAVSRLIASGHIHKTKAGYVIAEAVE